ncbi:cytochrome d ubiquinol oxidase subunit II [Nonomuraea pusilla]|uniref:Cytochrome d ubiquinol oxidase subunit II n=1 Tax=Nonomuraea pusilla TaxID=46177 RepID=A0A1H8IXR0_9ACTN|nr:cytochrome d ubiquinol oxidase subunit II [Nonomuraea pusilla]SEN73530.1 cytochrome d ubiquinol oxidase subunit II [Nonomuraea pusilla]
MSLLCAILPALLFAGYFVADGFDIGAGLLLRRLGRDERGRRAVLTSIGPFFLGNEVWLVAVGGLLAAVLPLLKDRVLGGLYLLVVAGLLIWVVRDAALWFRSRRPSARWRRRWDGVLAGVSTLFAGFWGVLVGVLLAGAPPLAGRWVVAAGNGALWAAVMVLLFATHGAAFLAARLPEDLASRAADTAARLAGPAATLLAPAVVVQLLMTVPRQAGPLVATALLGLLAVAALRAAPRALSKGRHGRAGAASAFAVAAPALLVGVRLAADPATATADPATLSLLGGFLIVLVPLLGAMQWWMWRTFMGRVGAGTPVFF